MRLKMMVAGCAMSACCLAATAQMDTMTPKSKTTAVAAAEMGSPAKALDDLLNLFEGEMMSAAKAMPAAQYSFAPSAATFAAGSPEKFDTVRTFSQQVTHVAEANYYFYMTLSGLKPDVDMKMLDAMTKDPMAKKDDALKMLAGSFAFAHKAIATITAENAFVTIKGADGITTRASLAAFGVAHGYDHYGQMVEYLRMNGIIPPASAK
jgi:uncharacterized damage-inducible protein DinB